MKYKKIASQIIILSISFCLFLISCKTGKSIIKDDYGLLFSFNVKQEAINSIKFKKDLFDYINDERLLRSLEVEKLIILNATADRLEVGLVNGDPVGEIYYTFQDSWHFKREHEVMEFSPEKGWIIWEQ